MNRVKARLDQILGALEGVLAIHKSLNNALEAQCNLTGSSYRGIQRRITRVLILSLISAVVGIVSLSLQLLQLLAS